MGDKDFTQGLLVVFGAIGTLIAIWTQPIPDYLRSLGTSLLATIVLFLFLLAYFTKKSELKPTAFKK